MGAHLHRFIERVEMKVSTCSGGASSIHLLGRCRMHDRINLVSLGGARDGEGGAAPLVGRGHGAQIMPVRGLRVGAGWGTPSLGHGGWLETAAF